MKNIIVGSFLALLMPVAGFSDALSLDALKIPQKPNARQPYVAVLKFSEFSVSATVKEVCFKWNGESPYCYDKFKVNTKRKQVSVSLRTKNKGAYRLQGAVRYELGGKKYVTNVVGKDIKVAP